MKSRVLYAVLIVAAAILLIKLFAVLAGAQEHGDDVECPKQCAPSDYPGEPPADSYTCAGACTHGDKDPCAEGQEAHDCGEWCRKPCCLCRKVHCP